MGTINGSNTPERCRVGLIFDNRMCIHSSPDEKDHPENPNRIRAIWDRLNDSGLVQRCVVLDAKKAEDNHLALVHSRKHINLIKTISSRSSRTMSNSAAKFDSVYFNGGSSTAAYLAAGSVIEVAERVAKGELDSAFAVVRPPGHHAEQDKPMGFCLCNNVAIATSFLLNERPELGMSKILIVDWDIHHGNGTQKMFYDDPRVLVFSVHRHESGRFYPHGIDGSYNMIGEGQGVGYNINVPWENGGCGDADYIAVWDHILIPVAKEFNPDMIIISAGFDAAKDDPIGGCCVSSYGYMVMLDKLMGFARGKIVMALEGGYNPASLADSTQSCIEVLLEEKTVISSLEDVPLKSTWGVIQAVRQALCRYWPELADTLPDNLINRRPSQIEADAAIQDEVDFREQAYEKLSNKGDGGVAILEMAGGIRQAARFAHANRNQAQQGDQQRPRNRGNRGDARGGQRGAGSSAASEVPPPRNRGENRAALPENRIVVRPSSSSDSRVVDPRAADQVRPPPNLAMNEANPSTSRPSRKRKRMPDTVAIKGKGKQVVEGPKGEGETSSSEEEYLWEFSRQGDKDFTGAPDGGPVLLRPGTLSQAVSENLYDRAQFSADHRHLFSESVEKVTYDAAHALISQVLPRLKNIQRRASIYADRKAKYKKMARSNDPAQIQAELDAEIAKYESLKDLFKKTEGELGKLKEDFQAVEGARSGLSDKLVQADERCKKAETERESWKTRALEAERKFNDTMNEWPQSLERANKEALVRFCHSKVFNFAASLHCLDEAQNAFNLAVEQGIHKGLTDPAMRGAEGTGLMFNKRCGEEDEDPNDPADTNAELEYDFLVKLIQDEYTDSHPSGDAAQSAQNDPPEDEPQAPIVEDAPVPAAEGANAPVPGANEPDDPQAQPQEPEGPVHGPVAQNILVIVDEDVASAA